jgi:hypothetical protein
LSWSHVSSGFFSDGFIFLIGFWLLSCALRPGPISVCGVARVASHLLSPEAPPLAPFPSPVFARRHAASRQRFHAAADLFGSLFFLKRVAAVLA